MINILNFIIINIIICFINIINKNLINLKKIIINIEKQP
jgi:hypothetical protein